MERKIIAHFTLAFKCTHMSIFVLQFPVAKQCFACLNSRILLLFIQILQFVNVILAFWFAFLQVDIRENALYYQYLKITKTLMEHFQLTNLSCSPIRLKHLFKMIKILKLKGTLEISKFNQSLHSTYKKKASAKLGDLPKVT